MLLTVKTSQAPVTCRFRRPYCATRLHYTAGQAWVPAKRRSRNGVIVATSAPSASPTPTDAEKPADKASTDTPRKPLILPDEDAEDSDLASPCASFIDYNGEFVQVMCCDYGFRSGAMRMYQERDGEIPNSVFGLAVDNFRAEYKALRRSFRFDEYKQISDANPDANIVVKAGRFLGGLVVQLFAAADKALEKSGLLSELNDRDAVMKLKEAEISDSQFSRACAELDTKLRQLKLSNDAVWDRERARESAGGKVETPWLIRIAYYSLCYMLDVLFENRPIQRFWFLENVARMPYFSYISMLHLYESFGWWRAGAELRKVHFAEEWNELHHLQIMESLGGDKLWVDRFLAYHASIVYYWLLILLYFFTPKLAYNFSELIEAHAVDTYGEFVDANADVLRSMPPPITAVKYYRGGDLYLFDEFQTSQRVDNPRRPACESLYDVFSNIRDDEGEHVKTMKACQDTSVVDDLRTREDARNAV